MKKKIMMFSAVLLAGTLFASKALATVTPDSSKICNVHEIADIQEAATNDGCEIIRLDQDVTLNENVTIEGKSLIVHTNLTINEGVVLTLSGLTTDIVTGRSGENNDQTNTSILLNNTSVLTINGSIVIKDNEEEVDPDNPNSKVQAIQTAYDNGPKTSKIIVGETGNLTIENCPRGFAFVDDVTVNGGEITLSDIENFGAHEVDFTLNNGAKLKVNNADLGLTASTNITTDETSSVEVSGESAYNAGTLKGNLNVISGSFTLQEGSSVDESSVITVLPGAAIGNDTGEDITIIVGDEEITLNSTDSYTVPAPEEPEETPSEKPADSTKPPKTGDINLAFLLMTILVSGLGLTFVLKKRFN